MNFTSKNRFSFTADSAYNFITLGNFYTTDEIQFVYYDDQEKDLCYYFTDSITIQSRVKIKGDTKICPGDSTVLTAYNADSYVWVCDDNPWEVISNEPEIIVSPQKVTSYTVYGPYTKSTTTVYPDLKYCEPILKMPNIFTPNGDGNNDYFVPTEFFAVKYSSIWIVNRWGTEVYNSIIDDSGWDGTSIENKPCPDGVYFWTISAEGHNGDQINLSGNVMLTR